MCTDRREFLRLSAGIAGLTLLGSEFDTNALAQQREVPASIRSLSKMTEGVVPISTDERLARIANAQRLMSQNKIAGTYLEPGASMFYFTGMRWGTSERMFALVIPARGEIAWVCPKFEEERARELIKFGNDVRTWEEDESPYRRVVEIFHDRGLRSGKIGIEERMRFFLYDGVRKEAQAF